MLCRNCQESETKLKAARFGDQLCVRCGRLVSPAYLVRRVRDKHLQLERFGLAGRRSALLERKRRREDR